MVSAPAIVRDGVLTCLQNGWTARFEVDTSDWHNWLETACTFTFRSSHGTFTARKERAGNGCIGERIASVMANSVACTWANRKS
jgi:hypothetical protein